MKVKIPKTSHDEFVVPKTVSWHLQLSICQKNFKMVMLLSLVYLGVRPGRKGREAWADYPKPLGGLYGGFWSKITDVKIIYGSPNVSKMSDTSEGINER